MHIKGFKIGQYNIGSDNSPFIIAELSANHNGNLERALSIVQSAAKAGVHALKLQTYTADTMTLNVGLPQFIIEDRDSLWSGRTLYNLYEEAHTPWDWHKPIFELADELGLVCFSTPFDETAVDFLEELNVPAYKIASFELTDLELIKKVASTGKPLIFSSGMGSIEELGLAIKTARESGCNEICILKCTSSYPASVSDSNILTLPDMQKRFSCQVGLSDHTLGIGAAIASVSHGAVIIEKHFTLSRDEGGVDSAFSMEPEEMRQLVVETNNAWKALGEVRYGVEESEKGSIQFRRSIYVVQDVMAGDLVSRDNVRCIRPGYGMQPKYLNKVIGKKFITNISAGTPLGKDLFN